MSNADDIIIHKHTVMYSLRKDRTYHLTSINTDTTGRRKYPTPTDRQLWLASLFYSQNYPSKFNQPDFNAYSGGNSNLLESINGIISLTISKCRVDCQSNGRQYDRCGKSATAY